MSLADVEKLLWEPGNDSFAGAMMQAAVNPMAPMGLPSNAYPQYQQRPFAPPLQNFQQQPQFQGDARFQGGYDGYHLGYIGNDARLSSPSILDWRAYYTDVLVPLYHHQPLLARRLMPNVRTIFFDGKETAEVGTYYDLDDPTWDMTPKEFDDKVSGEPKTILLPQMAKTTLLSDDERRRPFAQRDRLNFWSSQAIRKMAEFEDKIAFQGSTNPAIKGVVSTDSHEESTNGPWDVVDGNNIMTNAKLDLDSIVDYFVNEGLGDRPIRMGMTTYAYNKLRNTYQPFGGKSNLALWRESLPPGSVILPPSNNIQTGVSQDLNTVVAVIGLAPEEKGAYQLYSTGLDTRMKQEGLWSWRTGIRQKFGVKVVDDAYALFIDSIDTTT